MKLSNIPLCRDCNQEDETMKHILCDCSTLSPIHRTKLGQSFRSLEEIRGTADDELRMTSFLEEAHNGPTVAWCKCCGVTTLPSYRYNREAC